MSRIRELRERKVENEDPNEDSKWSILQLTSLKSPIDYIE